MGVVDFGGSDAPMTDEEIAKAGGDVLHVPTVLGAVAVVFNLSGIHSLKMDARTLAGIYLGKINKWDDDAIAALNPGINLPNKDILVARRSDGSGTTFIFSAYLSKVSLDWASRVGAGKSLSWPVGVGGKGNAGVAGVVKSKDGAIGYVELSYAVTNKLAMVALKNKSGNFVLPANESTTAAAAGAIAKMPKDFRVDLTNAAGANSYPIIGLTWLLVHKKQANAEKGKALVGFLKWALTSGQQYAPELYYSPLPDGLRSKVLAAVEAIRF
jgi:phosphate transport system substrate-binding protein